MKSLALKLIGHRHDSRFTWGEFANHWKHPKLALEYCPAGTFSHNTLILGLFFFSLYIHLPTRVHGDGCMRDKEGAYGFYTIDTSVCFTWADSRYYFYWPYFSFNHQSTEVLTLALQPAWIERRGDKTDFRVRFAEQEKAKQANCFSAPYRYRLKSGQIQDRIATVSIERRTWGRKWFPFLKLIKTTIDVQFNDEVGERTGSWKGGCIGCGYDMKPKETALDCLRRMEVERKF